MIQFGKVLQTGKPLLTTRWTYAGAAVVAVVAATLMALGGVAGSCSESQGQLQGRLNELQQTYASIYQGKSAEIQVCQSLECERPLKLEIATALRSYNQGLGHICWPARDQSLVTGLSAANSAEAAAYNLWADVTTPAEDQVQEGAVRHLAESQQAAKRAAVTRLQP